MCIRDRLSPAVINARLESLGLNDPIAVQLKDFFASLLRGALGTSAQMCIRDSIDTDRVKLLPIEDPVCHRDLILTCRENKADATQVRAFFEFLTGYFEKRRQEA